MSCFGGLWTKKQKGNWTNSQELTMCQEFVLARGVENTDMGLGVSGKLFKNALS